MWWVSARSRHDGNPTDTQPIDTVLLVSHCAQITHPPITRMCCTSAWSRDDGRPTSVFICCLLWIEKTRGKDKTYEWGSVGEMRDLKIELRNLHVSHTLGNVIVYYESINRDLKRRLIYEYRCDERLKTKNEESTRLGDSCCLLWINKARSKDKMYIWVSVWWKTTI